jgi:hypothetical protein
MFNFLRFAPCRAEFCSYTPGVYVFGSAAFVGASGALGTEFWLPFGPDCQ